MGNQRKQRKTNIEKVILNLYVYYQTLNIVYMYYTLQIYYIIQCMIQNIMSASFTVCDDNTNTRGP